MLRFHENDGAFARSYVPGRDARMMAGGTFGKREEGREREDKGGQERKRERERSDQRFGQWARPIRADQKKALGWEIFQEGIL